MIPTEIDLEIDRNEKELTRKEQIDNEKLQSRNA